MVEKRYQVSQVEVPAPWSYGFNVEGFFKEDNEYTYPAMTCAGLLGLALGEGVQPKPGTCASIIASKQALA